MITEETVEQMLARWDAEAEAEAEAKFKCRWRDCTAGEHVCERCIRCAVSAPWREPISIMERMRVRRRITCPRCDGTGEHEFYDGCFEGCHACAKKGHLTIKEWNAWCDERNRAPTLASQLGKRCPDCECGASEQDCAKRCHWHAIGFGLSIPRAAHTKGSNGHSDIPR
jgi:hypothetical protein